MPFTVQDFDDLIQLLDQRPDWREALRRRVMGEDYLTLPELVRELVTAQRQTDQHVDQLAERMDQLTQRVDQLTQRLDQFSQRVDQFIASADRRLSRLEDDSAKLKGMILEQQYAARPFSYFKQILRRARTLTSEEVYDLLESDGLTDAEIEEVLDSDVIVAGRQQKTGERAYLVAEVSWGIGPDDVTRAAHRAALLARTGQVAIPVVAGDWITPEAMSAVEKERMWYVLGGRAVHVN
jgi:vacuolar-type H+-ATPase subunit I/STV1